MTTRRERVREQTRVRRELLANGYTPLANDDKRCMLPGWPRLVVDEGVVDGWADQLRYQATGVRLDGPLTVIDVDVDDEGVIDEIVDRLPDDVWARVGRACERRGKGSKVAWFVRCGESFQRFASMAFCRPDEDPEGDGVVLHRVEIFGPGATRQFGAFGAHTLSGGNPVVEYWWPGTSLLDVPLDELQAITKADADAVCRTANEVLADRGWHRHQRSRSGETSAGHVYDLRDGMVFETRDHGTQDLPGMQALVEAEDSVRLSASWLEGPAAANRTRCIAGVAPDGGLMIYETAAGDVHRLAESEPRPVGGGLRGALSALREGRLFGGETSPPEPDAPRGEDGGPGMGDVFERTVHYLLSNYVFAPSEAHPVIPLQGGAAMTYGNFKMKYAPFVMETTGPKGGVTKHHPVEEWKSSPERVDVIGPRFAPWTRDRLVHIEGEGQAVNTYRPAPLDDVAPLGGDVWRAFLTHLVPDEEERAWFRMWLGAKVQRPWVPSCAVLMFTQTQGTGRGTLVDMLEGVFGEDHVSPVTSLQLLGEGGQSQYTDWLADALLVTCDELLGGDETGANMAWKRHKAYEHLKGLFDPRARRMTIVRKGESNYKATVYASYLLASNNPNALPLALEDRRVAVLRNTARKLTADGDLSAAMDALRCPRGRGFVAGLARAVRDDLAAVEVDWAAVRDAPEWLAGREEMIAANETDLDEVIENVVVSIPGDYITGEDLRTRLARGVEAAGLTGQGDRWWSYAVDKLSRDNRTGWRVLRNGVRQNLQPKEPAGRRGRVYYRMDGLGEDVWGDTALRDRPALLAGADDRKRGTARIAAAARAGTLRSVDD